MWDFKQTPSNLHKVRDIKSETKNRVPDGSLSSYTQKYENIRTIYPWRPTHCHIIMTDNTLYDWCLLKKHFKSPKACFFMVYTCIYTVQSVLAVSLWPLYKWQNYEFNNMFHKHFLAHFFKLGEACLVS